MLDNKVHEVSQRRLAQLCSTPQRDFILAEEFQCEQSRYLLGKIRFLQIGSFQESSGQNYVYCFHNLEVS